MDQEFLAVTTTDPKTGPILKIYFAAIRREVRGSCNRQNPIGKASIGTVRGFAFVAVIEAGVESVIDIELRRNLGKFN